MEFHLHIKPDDLHHSIPPMTLQLLVENVVKHNVISTKNPMQIHILSTESGITISNPIQLKSVEASWGIGLENIKSRYKRMGKECKVEQDNTTFNVFLPYI